jgi:hypothetical protein
VDCKSESPLERMRSLGATCQAGIRLIALLAVLAVEAGCASPTEPPPVPPPAAGGPPTLQVAAVVEEGMAFRGLPLRAVVRIRGADPTRAFWICTPVVVKWEPLGGVAVGRERFDLPEGAGFLKPILLAPGETWTLESWVSRDISFRGEGQARLQCRVSVIAGWPGEEETGIGAPPVEESCELQVHVTREAPGQRRAVVDAILVGLASGEWEQTMQALGQVKALPEEEPDITAALGRLCESEDEGIRYYALGALIHGGPVSKAAEETVRRRAFDRLCNLSEPAFAWLAKHGVWLSEDECRRAAASDSWGHLEEFVDYLVVSKHPERRRWLEELARHPREVISEKARSLLEGLR